MKRKIFKALAAVLAVTMTFSCVSFSSYAVETNASAYESVKEDTTDNKQAPEESVSQEEENINIPEIIGFENTADGTKVSWSKYEGAVKYRLFYLDSENVWRGIGNSDTTSLIHSKLKSETTYIYTVRAMNKDGNFISDYNKNGYANTFYAPPTINSLTNINEGVNIEWSKFSGVENYRVYRRTKDSNWKNIGEVKGTAFVDQNASSGTGYSYTVRCLDENGNLISYYNQGKSITYVKTPSISNIKNTATGATISWSKCSGASKYRVYYLDSENVWRGLGNTTSTSFTHDKLTTGTAYTYTVRCLDSKGNFVSGYDKNGVSNTFITTPEISTLRNINGGVEISWGKLDGAKSYRVYRKTSKSDWGRIGETADTTYVDQNASSGTNYTYTVRCLDENGNLISYFNQGKSITYVKTPSITNIKNTATGATISWSKCDGASKYRVYYLDSENVWRGLGNTTSTSFTHDKLTTGTEYTYTVRCLDSKGNFVSGYDKNGASNTFITTPEISALTNINGGVEISWGKLDGAKSYRVYRKTSKSDWGRIGETAETTYVDQNASSGTNYTYTVRCLDENGNLISYYNQGKRITYVKTPSITGIENTETGAKISWTKCDGASKYRVYYLDSENVWRGLGNTTSTSFTHDKLTTGTEYTYTVRCLDSKGNFVSGYDKTGKTNLFLAPPEIASISKTDGGNLIEWNAVQGAEGYRLYRKTVGESWGRIADLSETEYVDSSVKENTVYTYTLRCLDKDGNLITSYISNTKYYYNGSLADGKITSNGETYYFNKGVFRSGLQTINGNKYYYDSTGALQKNGIVGSDKDGWYYADKNGKIDFTYSNAVTQGGNEWIVMSGKATKVTTKSDKTLFRALKIVAKITDNSMSKSQKLRKCFDYVKGAYTELNPRIPHYHGSDWPIVYANDMFVDGAGNCFSYAAAFAYMAKAIGYEKVYCCNSGGHGWAEVDGLIYDPEWSRHHSRDYYALNYNTTKDPNYKAAIAPGYSWMHVKI